jgi:hypothetical protein
LARSKHQNRPTPAVRPQEKLPFEAKSSRQKQIKKPLYKKYIIDRSMTIDQKKAPAGRC